VIHGTIEGGLGTDTVIGPNAAATWIINGSGAGSLNAMPISGIENLTGGSGVDTFDIAPGGSLAGLLNGGTGGRNVLSYAQWSAPVSVNLATKVATAIGGQVSNVAVVVGGSGDDQLTGNASLPSVLVGGPGSDTLTGGSGRDILIGGSGADSLTGAAGDDLLIAGRTSFDQNAQALLAILDEWSTTARPYATRVNNLRGIDSGTRLNGSYFLQNEPTDTLESDPGTLDSLIGGLGQDWFITDDPTDTTDQVTSGTTPEQREDATP
jgi:Ca2+-binding RTX toxin-like protein